MYKRNYSCRMNVMEENLEMGSCIKILANINCITFYQIGISIFTVHKNGPSLHHVIT